MRLHALTSLLLFATLVAPARDAAACSPECADTKIGGPTMPSSTPALPIAFGNVLGEGEATTGFELRGSQGLIDGQLISLGRFHGFRPSAPLAPGDYTVRLRSDCEGASPHFVEKALTVTESAGWPLTTGTLSVESAKRGAIDVASSAGECYASIAAASVSLNLEEDPSLVPYHDVLLFETFVDEIPWSRTYPGSGRFTQSTRSLLSVYAACEPDASNTRGADLGLTPGLHQVSVRAILPGGEEIPAARLHGLIVSCDDRNGEVEAHEHDVVDGGPGGGGGSSGTSSSSGGAAGDGVNTSSGGGCSTTAPGEWATFSAIGALALLWRRRRAVKLEN